MEYNATHGLSQAIAQINAAVASLNLYARSHPQVERDIRKAHAALGTLTDHRPEITLLCIDDDLVADNQTLTSAGPFMAAFGRLLTAKGIERLTFRAGLPLRELAQFIDDLASPGETPVRSSPGIRVGRVELPEETADDVSRLIQPEDVEDLATDAAGVGPEELGEVRELYRAIQQRKNINVHSLDEIVDQFARFVKHNANPLRMLVSIKSAHEYTFTHAINVGILTMSQAKALGFRGAQLHHIRVASILHDVGKLFIPEEILSKPAALTPEASKRRLPEIAARATLPSDSPGASVIAEGDGGGAGGQRIVPAANLPAAFKLPVSRSDQPLAAQNRAL
ncbi:MAG: HD domain-containing protein [Desulfobacterales bacterium]|nr:HD domain-containing protein [Desulfobacterales bacterium]